MGINYAELISTIEKIAPPFLMEEWDNSGIQIKISDEKIKKILVALEITDEAIQEAVHREADFIITHHPLIFNKINAINADQIPGRYLNKLISQGLSVYSAHTTFDKAMGGNNDYLISRLKLEMTSEVGTGNFQEFGIGRIVKLRNPAKLDLITMKVLEGLGIPAVEIRTVGDGSKSVGKVAVCTGSGASLIQDALENGCELLITGDIKYHDAQLAKELGICLIDAGHYYTEKIFSPNFTEKLNKLVGEKVIIVESQINLNPFGN